MCARPGEERGSYSSQQCDSHDDQRLNKPRLERHQREESGREGQHALHRDAQDWIVNEPVEILRYGSVGCVGNNTVYRQEAAPLQGRRGKRNQGETGERDINPGHGSSPRGDDE